MPGNRLKPLLCAAALLLFASGATAGDLHATQAWSRATPPGTSVGVGYVVLHNMGKSAAVVIGASSPVARQVEMHESRQSPNGLMQMRPLERVVVPAGGAISFVPNGPHLMLTGLGAPLLAGQRVPVTLRLEGGAEVTFELEVRPLTSTDPPAGPAAGTHHGP